MRRRRGAGSSNQRASQLTKLGLAWVNYQILRRSAVTLLNAQGADWTNVQHSAGTP